MPYAYIIVRDIINIIARPYSISVIDIVGYVGRKLEQIGVILVWLLLLTSTTY